MVPRLGETLRIYSKMLNSRHVRRLLNGFRVILRGYMGSEIKIRGKIVEKDKQEFVWG